ncbi:MAG: hypothetical protein R3F59_29990 [Myxococcota bacterium]
MAPHEAFFAGWYRDPDPEVAAAAVAWVLGQGPAGPPATILLALAASALRRPAPPTRRSPRARRRSPTAASASCSTPPAAARSRSADVPVVTPATSTYVQWADFLVTGDEAPVGGSRPPFEREDRTAGA